MAVRDVAMRRFYQSVPVTCLGGKGGVDIKTCSVLALGPCYDRFLLLWPLFLQSRDTKAVQSVRFLKTDRKFTL